MMIDIKYRLALHNAQVELEALKAEGRAMTWENEHRLRAGNALAYGDEAFNSLAARIRETAVKIDDAVVLEGIRS